MFSAKRDSFARRRGGVSPAQAFGEWLKQQGTRVSPKSRLGEKLSYISYHWDGLQLCFNDGRVEMYSNSIENFLGRLHLQ